MSEPKIPKGFSKTGERTGFITKVIDSDNPYNIMLHEFGLKIVKIYYCHRIISMIIRVCISK